MSSLQKYQNKNIAIYGMGKTGFSVAKIFKKLNIKIFCWDDNIKIRKKLKKNSFYNLNRFWKEANQVDYIVISPGIDINKCKITNYLKKNSERIITDLDIFFELNKKKNIISITGTNGKSTTCKILEKILKADKYKVVTLGNIGKPILDYKDKSKNKKSIIILEVSSYQLQYSKIFRSEHAAILNISPDHLDRHKTISNYAKTKSRIFHAQRKNDYLYINASNKYSKLFKRIYKNKKIKSKLIMINKSSYEFLLQKINNKYFKSTGNFENLIFAYKIARNFKVTDKTIVNALNRFKGLPHRQEIVLSTKKILCINDSKATSFDAALQSLTSHTNIYWIVGGSPKDKDYFKVNDIKNRIVKAYIVGKNTSFFTNQLKKDISYFVANNLKNALKKIKKDIKINIGERKTILFSPAAASFDQFKNFESRGNYFKKLLLKNFKEKSHA